MTNRQFRKFLEKLPVTSIELDDNDLTIRCKFNFSYFTVQEKSQDFGDWSQNELVKLLEKLKNYSGKSLNDWKNESAGKSGKVLSIYGKFPNKSEFSMPTHIPLEAEWGRFRLEQSVRLVGFVLPSSFHQTQHKKTGVQFDCNTFYIVFLDRDHKFYLTETK